jgi:EpsI family protein
MLTFRGLLTFRPRTGRMLDAESFFFEPSDTSPPIVLILVLWLAMRRSKRFARLAALEGSRWVTGGLVAASMATLGWALHVGAPDLQAVALFFNLLAIANLLGGAAALRIAIVPACVLGFALPMPGPFLNAVVWKAQIWTAEYSGFLLELLHMPAMVSGDQILRSNAVFAIIETCSGLRGIETLTLLAFLMADLFGRRGWHAFALVVVAPPIAFMINGFRALGLILNPHSDIEVVHNAQGIIMLLVGVLVLYGVDGLLSRYLRRPPLVVQEAPPGTRRARLIPRLVVMCGITTIMMGISYMVPATELVPLRAARAGEIIPEAVAGWTSTAVETDWLFLGKVGMRQVVHREYTKRGRRVSMFVGLGASELRFQSVLSPKTGVPGSGWIIEEEGEIEVGGHPATYRVVRKGTRRLLVQHWYEGLGGVLSESLRVVSGIDGSKFRRNRNTLVVRLATRMGRGTKARAAAESTLEEFAGLLSAPLEQLQVSDPDA